MRYNRGMPKMNSAEAGSQLLLLAIVLVSLLSSLPPSYMKYLPLFPPLSRAILKNPTGAREERFSSAKALLKNELILGYLDEGFSNIDYKDGKRIGPYYLAQYAMAPTVLENNTTAHRYVLGNFDENFSYQPISEKRGLRVFKDFGNGLVLFQSSSD